MAAKGKAEDDDHTEENVSDGATTTTNISLIPTAPPVTKMQASLMETLSYMSIRSEVQECMNAMLLDVEITFYLKQELELQATKHAMETMTKHHQATILEANAEREARESEHVVLADQMVQQVMALSREMEDLLQWKRDHAHKVQEYESLVAKLAQAEVDLESVKEKAQHLATFEAETVEDGGRGQPNKEEIAPVMAKGIKVQTPEESKPVDLSIAEETQTVLATGKSSITADPSLAEGADTFTVTNLEETEEGAKPDHEGTSSSITMVESHTAAVTLDADEPEEEVPDLLNVDVEILMVIFGFLDAMDILNLAQINLCMYSKIDNIFGISEDGQSPPQPPPAAAPSTTAKSTVAALTPAMKPDPSPTIASLNSGPTVSGVASGPIGNRLFSMLQPARTGPGAKKTTQAMNPSVAQSMASKLTDTEIAAILSMTDKLNRMDKEVTKLRNEKEVIEAKLDGTEAVKQFLINKVRDVEQKLAQSRDDEVKVTQQIASDQEVIAFLDSRVQELERQTETLTKDKSRAQTELETIKVQTSKKITMLSDMLKYEREKLKEEEGDWKATKKVLVREVKSCRAQILALQAERDGLKEQNEMLKRAIVSTGKSARATSPLR